jgi:DNA-binding transcriptional ArsR family regulator
MYNPREVAAFAHAFADETRLRLLSLLLFGDATVSELAVHLGLPQPRVSTHLAVLRAAGLVAADPAGRQRTYRVDADRARAVLNALQAAATGAPERAKTGTRAPRIEVDATPVRRARTCYDHLAGIAGVQLLDELVRRGWLTIADVPGGRPQYGLTPAGVHALLARGVDLGKTRQSRRLFAYGCLDWSERRPHLAGALGAAVLDALASAGIARCEGDSRVVRIVRPLTDWLDRPNTVSTSTTKG